MPPEQLPDQFTLPLAGRRRPDTQHLDELPEDLQPGDYWYCREPHPTPHRRTEWLGTWMAYIPGGPVVSLPLHHVVEHDDDTITVERDGGGISNSIPGHCFHGWVRHGVWTT